MEKIGFLCVITLIITACTVPENNIPLESINGIKIIKNMDELNPVADSSVYPTKRGSFEILEGQQTILSVMLFPQGVTGGIHWQSSGRGIVEMSAMSGSQIIFTGSNGGRTNIRVLARNSLNEVYAEAECGITVIPSSFFKWNYIDDGWLELPALSNANMSRINPKIARSGETAILPDEERGGLVLEGPGVLIIGSVMSAPTNSPFSSAGPLYDIGGTMDFLNGPSFNYLEWVNSEQELKKKHYPMWNKNVRITVYYETENPAASPLRIQVNNNTLERDNASAITNWFVTELTPNAPSSGALSGVFSAKASERHPAVNSVTSLEDILSNSFVTLALPRGRILIRSIKIESAD